MKYKLVCFDVDGTIIDGIDSIWPVVHDGLKVNKATLEKAKKKYFAGELDFEQWALYDINLWKDQGATKQDIMKTISSLRLMKGTKETLDFLKKKGVKMAIISGSLNIALEKVMPDYNDYFDYVFINWIYFDDNGKIADINAKGFDAEQKAEALRSIAEKEKINLNEVVFIGDHHNDIQAAAAAGLGISFNSKSRELDKVSDVIIKNNDLREILKYISS